MFTVPKFPELDDEITKRFKAMDARLKAKQDAVIEQVKKTDQALDDLRRTTCRPVLDEAELNQAESA